MHCTGGSLFLEEKKLKQKKKKKGSYKYLLLALILIAIIGGTLTVAILSRSEFSREYKEMESVSLPTVRVSYLDSFSTLLHGYTTEMDVVSMRDTIVPLDENRGLSIDVLPYENEVLSFSYALYTTDQKNYIDGGTYDSFSLQSGCISFHPVFSELLESGTEYQLILTVETEARPVYFYTRVLFARTNYARELMSFVTEFSDSTYDRDKAAEFLVNYIQPDDSDESDDYAYSDIHSKFATLTYGSLDVTRESALAVRITELAPTQMSVTLDYKIHIQEGGVSNTYRVNEFFCVRYRSEKVYILDYYRTLKQEFTPEASTGEKGRILLGIGNGDTQVLSTKSEQYTTFVENRRIWSYNAKTNAMNMIFGFSEDGDTTGRSTLDRHEVQIVKLAENGDVDYMVYGYMNRGPYEGQVGVLFYRYYAENNSTRLLFYLPIQESEQMLMMDVGTLAYVNEDDVCYLRYGDSIYSIDLNSGESVEVSIRAYPGMYAKNAQGNVVAWQEGDKLNYPERLVILNMDSQTTIVVNAPEGEYVKILDFIGDDIVYGFGRESDSVFIANVDTQQLLSRLVIASTDEKLTIREEYEAKDCFIMDAVVKDTRVSIQRGVRDSGGRLSTIDDDVLLLTQNIVPNSGTSMLMSRNVEPLKKTYYIQIDSVHSSAYEFSSAAPRFETPRNVNELRLERRESNVYYVYGHGRLLYSESEIRKAISEAFDIFGVVVDTEMNSLWNRGTRDLMKTISIQPYVSESNDQSLVAALRILCAQEGKQLPEAEADLRNGMNPMEIIDQALYEGAALNLYGCSLSEMLYFVNLSHPVIAVTGDRSAIVIIGYETDAVTLYFPVTGETMSLDNNSAAAYFEQNGNSFISYR